MYDNTLSIDAISFSRLRSMIAIGTIDPTQSGHLRSEVSFIEHSNKNGLNRSVSSRLIVANDNDRVSAPSAIRVLGITCNSPARRR